MAEVTPTFGKSLSTYDKDNNGLDSTEWAAALNADTALQARVQKDFLADGNQHTLQELADVSFATIAKLDGSKGDNTTKTGDSSISVTDFSNYLIQNAVNNSTANLEKALGIAAANSEGDTSTISENEFGNADKTILADLGLKDVSFGDIDKNSDGKITIGELNSIVQSKIYDVAQKNQEQAAEMQEKAEEAYIKQIQSQTDEANKQNEQYIEGMQSSLQSIQKSGTAFSSNKMKLGSDARQGGGGGM